MNREVYLASDVVSQFVDWISANLNTATFRHNYVKRRPVEQWTCDSLHDAFGKYSWRHPAIARLDVPEGNSFATNATALAAMKAALHNALCAPASGAMACQAAIDVMSWGGVRGGNVRWLYANEEGLANSLI